ncbi:uncharacterized protein V6R79_002419 [Siganus canaliculatus]
MCRNGSERGPDQKEEPQDHKSKTSWTQFRTERVHVLSAGVTTNHLSSLAPCWAHGGGPRRRSTAAVHGGGPRRRSTGAVHGGGPRRSVVQVSGFYERTKAFHLELQPPANSVLMER